MLVGDNIGDSRVGNLNDAINLAESMGMDLIQVDVRDNTSICKIGNYSKKEYTKKKNSQKNKAKLKKVTKEIRMGASIAEHDIRVKAKAIDRIIKDGHKVKITITYKGREIQYMDSMKLIKFTENISVGYKVDKWVQIEGNKLYMIISPDN